LVQAVEDAPFQGRSERQQKAGLVMGHLVQEEEEKRLKDAREQELLEKAAEEARAAEARKEQEAAERQRQLEEEEAKAVSEAQLRREEARRRAGNENALVRQELRRLPRQDQLRFCTALRKAMENKADELQSSDYFRIAGSGGWPGRKCPCAEETFPGWHRGLLVNLERALIEADLALGNDGNLSLPYWDWLNLEVEGQVVPKCIRECFGELPASLVDSQQANELSQLGYTRLASDAEIRARLSVNRLNAKVASAFSDGEHWTCVSKRCRRRGYTLESCHDEVCMACGFPLSDPAYAAFHPLFFLHQCNLDRIYESYLQQRGPQECSASFRLRQEQLHENRDEPDRFEKALEPFGHPLKKRPLLPVDTFDTLELGYIYDELPLIRPPPVTPLPPEDVGADTAALGNSSAHGQAPVYAAFRGLSSVSLQGRSFSLHVFVARRGVEPAWAPPAGSVVDWQALPEYAGCAAARGSGGSSASGSSAVARPFDAVVEVQDTLHTLKLSRYDAELRVVCVDQLGQTVPLEDTPVPPPVLVGPFLEDAFSELREGSEGGDVAQLQRRLAALGYDVGEADGTYSSQVRAAVERFQDFGGLEVDGVTGPATKALLMARRKDLAPDAGVTSEVRKCFVEGETVHYRVQTLPRHLERQRGKMLLEIAIAFAQWGQAMNVTFALAEETEDESAAPALTVRFEDLSELGALHHGGLALPGGQLLEVSQDVITLDAGERWLLRDETGSPEAPRLFPVLLHAIGRILGLPHSSEKCSAMWPYCDDQGVELSETDKALARSAVKNTKPCGCRDEGQGCVVQ